MSDLRIGDDVSARMNGKPGYYYPANIISINKNGTYGVMFKDGSKDIEVRSKHLTKINDKAKSQKKSKEKGTQKVKTLKDEIPAATERTKRKKGPNIEEEGESEEEKLPRKTRGRPKRSSVSQKRKTVASPPPKGSTRSTVKKSLQTRLQSKKHALSPTKRSKRIRQRKNLSQTEEESEKEEDNDDDDEEEEEDETIFDDDFDDSETETEEEIFQVKQHKATPTKQLSSSLSSPTNQSSSSSSSSSTPIAPLSKFVKPGAINLPNHRLSKPLLNCHISSKDIINIFNYANNDDAKILRTVFQKYMVNQFEGSEADLQRYAHPSNKVRRKTQNQVIKLSNLLIAEGRDLTWIENSPEQLLQILNLFRDPEFAPSKFTLSLAFNVILESFKYDLIRNGESAVIKSKTFLESTTPDGTPQPDGTWVLQIGLQTLHMINEVTKHGTPSPRKKTKFSQVATSPSPHLRSNLQKEMENDDTDIEEQEDEDEDEENEIQHGQTEEEDEEEDDFDVEEEMVAWNGTSLERESLSASICQFISLIVHALGDDVVEYLCLHELRNSFRNCASTLVIKCDPQARILFSNVCHDFQKQLNEAKNHS